MPHEMEVHEEFTRWAVERGVQINGIRAHKSEGRGLGIIAEKDLEIGETLLTIPFSTLINVDTVPTTISSPLLPSGITIHGLLATTLILTHSLPPPWHAVLPSSSSLPLLWPPLLQLLLPPSAASLLTHQKHKLALDWTHTSAHFPATNYEEYLHAWCLLNTRTFYYVSQRTSKKRHKPKNADDCLALLPLGDYFNHSSRPTASASYTGNSYGFTALSAIRRGEEIYISYGSHSNDYLLAEYGFVMDENEDDAVSLDAAVLPLLDEGQKKRLEEERYLGGYVLDSTTKEVCHRTQVALRMICLKEGKWKRFVNGVDSGERDQEVVDELLMTVLQGVQNDVEDMIGKLSEIGQEEIEQRDVLTRRWMQIQSVVTIALERLQVALGRTRINAKA